MNTELSLKLLKQDCESTIYKLHQRINIIRNDIAKISTNLGASIELTYPKSWKPEARTISSISFRLENSMLLTFMLQPCIVYINCRPMENLDDAFTLYPLELTGELLQKMIDYVAAQTIDYTKYIDLDFN